jgi:hypothetical protein
MPELDDIGLSSAVPDVATAFRRRIRTGFALCAAALGAALVYLVATITGLLAVTSSGTNLELKTSAAWKLSGLAVEGLTTAILIAGLVLLYRVPYGPRWRWAGTLLLAMCGADVALFSLRASGGDAKALALASLLGYALSWVELWMLAVLAAEAAEAAERPEITYQTEIVGKLVIWGGFAWLLATVWSFDPARLGDTSMPSPPDQFIVVVDSAAFVLLVMALARTLRCCVGVVSAYAPAPNDVSASG